MNGMLLLWNLCFFAVLVQKADYNAIQGINLYPVDNAVICFPNSKCTYLAPVVQKLESTMHLAPVVQKVDNVFICWIVIYRVDSAI